MKIWIARDGEENKETDVIYIYLEKPEFSEQTKEFRSEYRAYSLPIDLFPAIANGECYEAEISLGAIVLLEGK